MEILMSIFIKAFCFNNERAEELNINYASNIGVVVVIAEDDDDEEDIVGPNRKTRSFPNFQMLHCNYIYSIYNNIFLTGLIVSNQKHLQSALIQCS